MRLPLSDEYDVYADALMIVNREEASSYFCGLVDRHATKYNISTRTAEHEVRGNIGYRARTLPAQDRQRIEALYDGVFVVKTFIVEPGQLMLMEIP